MSDYENRKVLSCRFNIDTACVELKLSDGTMLSIDCTAVEDELEADRFQQSELDYLIYNDPAAYADLNFERHSKSPPQGRDGVQING